MTGILKTFCRRFLIVLRAFIDCSSDLMFGLVNSGKSEAPLPPLTNPILLDSAVNLAAKVRTKKVKCTELVESFIARIKEVNPLLNAVVDDRFYEALEEAKVVDELVASGLKTPQEMEQETPFLGVPFTTKDCFQVKGLHQTVGLVSMANSVSEEDADAVALMRGAGAIILGVTNISELCMWWESNNNVYGRTNNPYNTTRIVGGSSGGEGCIICAAGSAMGIGSDIGGSIRMPAYFNGIFGHKPSTGIVSNRGQKPTAAGERDTFLGTGPMTRFASDLLPMLKVLAGSQLNQLKLDEPVNIKSLRYFYMEDDGGSILASKVNPEVKMALYKVVNYLEMAHGIKATKVDLNSMKYALQMWSSKMSAVKRPTFCEEMAERKGSVNPFWEFLKWVFWCSSHTLPAILLGIFEHLNVHDPEDTKRQEDSCNDLKKEFKDLLGEDGVFLYPTHPRLAPYHNQPILMGFNFVYTAIFNILGLPATHCPLGLSKGGLPLGIQVAAGQNNDHLCLAVAQELEKAFGGWVCPSAIL